MPTILGANTLSTGYNVANSLRFNIGSSDNLTRTLGTATNGKKFTISVWTKLIEDPAGNAQEIMAGGSDGSNETFLRYNSNETISFRHDHSSDTNWHIKTNRLFRDPSAWYHIVAAFDSTQGTDSNRAKIYINGVQETSLATSDYPAQNEETFLNVNAGVSIGKTNYAGEGYIGGYMSEFVFIDGQALDPTSFGEFDEDSPTIWKPINVSGLTFGNNGFYLQFKQTGTSANSSGLGADTSGNDLHFTVGNLTAVDQSTDTCTNNYATFNPLDNYYLSGTFTEGNLKVSIDNGSTEAFTTSTIGVSSGKWYMENKIITTSSGRLYSGVVYGTAQATNDWPGGGDDQWFYRSEDGKVYNEGSEAYTGATLADDDIVGIALDLDNHKLYFSKNGTFNNSGDPTSGSTGTGAIALDTGQTYFFAVGESGSTAVVSSANFGSPSFSISSGNSDANGYGNFEYSVPSGYYALNTKNLAEFG